MTKKSGGGSKGATMAGGGKPKGPTTLAGGTACKGPTTMTTGKGGRPSGGAGKRR
jgi:hypothetical protein